MIDLSTLANPKPAPETTTKEKKEPVAFIRLELSPTGQMTADMKGTPEMLFKMTKAALGKAEFAGVVRGAITMLQQEIALESQVSTLIKKNP